MNKNKLLELLEDMEKINLIDFLSNNKIKLDNSLCEKIVIGSPIILNTYIYINPDKRMLIVTYTLPLNIEEDLWRINKVIRKPPEKRKWYLGVYQYKIIYFLLRNIIDSIYIHIAKKYKWGYNIRERPLDLKVGDNLMLGLIIRPSENRDYKGDIIKIIKQYDIEIYKKITKKRYLSEIGKSLSHSALGKKRKEIKKKIEKSAVKRMKEIEKLKLQNIYIERLKGAKLIDDNYSMLWGKKEFIPKFKKLAIKIINNEKPTYAECLCCQDNYEVLTEQNRKYCTLACKQKEYRARQ
jgi:hypothetical protein